MLEYAYKFNKRGMVMSIVKEELNEVLAREWAMEFGVKPHTGNYWAVDKERKAYLTFLTQDREMNDDGSVLRYYLFFFNGKFLYLDICSAGGDDDKKIYYYEIRNNQFDVDLFNQAKEFGLDDFFTTYKQYGDVIKKKWSDYKYEIVCK